MKEEAVIFCHNYNKTMSQETDTPRSAKCAYQGTRINAQKLHRIARISQANYKNSKMKEESTRPDQVNKRTMYEHIQDLEAQLNASKAENANLRAGLLLAARWGISSDGYSASVASELRAWIIDDMRKPAPTAPDYYPTKP